MDPGMAYVHSVLSSVAVFFILLCTYVPASEDEGRTEDGSPISLASHSLSSIVASHVASELHVVCEGWGIPVEPLSIYPCAQMPHRSSFQGGMH